MPDLRASFTSVLAIWKVLGGLMVMLDCGILGLYGAIYGDDVMMIETLINSK